MKLIYTNTTGKLTLEAEVPNSVTAFETMAEFTEVFDETCCGVCASVNIRFDVRRPQTFVYYNLVCRDCGSRLDVGQHKTTKTLFISRKDDAGNPLPNAGWYKYQPEGGKCTTPAPRTEAQTRKPTAAVPFAAEEAGQHTDADLAAIAGCKASGQLDSMVKHLEGQPRKGDHGRPINWDVLKPAIAAKRAELAAASEPDAYAAAIAAAKHKGTLFAVGEAIAADETVTATRRTFLRAAYESRLQTINRAK